MSSLNLAKIILAGHLVREPELKMTPSQIPCTTVTVAVSRKSESSAEIVTDYYTVIAWRSVAEFLCKFFRKGSAIYVDGKLRIRTYTDKNGVQRKIPEVVASDISFVDSKNAPTTEIPEEQPQAFATAVPSAPIRTEMLGGTDDDLPF